MNKVRRGELALPEMQRRYVWPATRVRDLLDSLYRGYPSGTILVWATDGDVETREMAVAPTDDPTTQRLLLLDGQQRLTSLAALMSGEPVQVRNRRRPIDVLFNLDHPDGPPIEATEVDIDEFTVAIDDVEDEEDAERDIQEELAQRTFVVASRALAQNPRWVSVADIFSKRGQELLRPLGINSDDELWDKYSERLQRVRKIADYPYVMQQLDKAMTYEEVTEIFVRVNSLGMKLRGSDLALAQVSSKWKGFVRLIEEFAGRFNDDSDYIMRTGLPIRLVTVFATKQSKFKTIGRVPKEHLEKAWQSAQEGLEFAVNFVRSNAGVDRLEHLSSPFLLVPLAVYWIHKDGAEVSENDRRTLLRWFYYAHMRGHYGMGSSESILDRDLAALFKDKGLDELLDRLHLHVKKFPVDAADLVGRNTRSPFFSMLYLVFKHQGARDWFSGLELSSGHAGAAHTIQHHHIFPKSLLRQQNHEQKEINEIANLAFIGGRTNRRILNKEPINYLENIVETSGEETLQSQLIPLDRKLWQLSSYQDFLAWRREEIAKTINSFMENLAE